MVRVTVARGGQTQVLEVDPERSLLQGAEAASGSAIPVGCRGGGCGVCKVRVLEGRYRCKRMSRAHISECEADAGYVLACRTFALSDLKLELPSLAQTVE